MRCHYINDPDDPEAEKILIPECWAVVMSNDIDMCTCTASARIKKSLSEQVEELKAENRNLKLENEWLREKLNI